MKVDRSALRSFLVVGGVVAVWLTVAPGLAMPQAAETGKLFASGVRVGVSQFMAQNAQESPCDDPLYLELKKKPLNDLSEREFQYFQQKEKDCAEYRRLLLIRGQQTPPSAVTPSASMVPIEKHGMSAGAVIAFSILGTVAFFVLLGALAS